MDIWTKEKRSYVMGRILSQNTGPEKHVRKILSSMGYRYRLNAKNLPGKPDVVLPKHKSIIFIHGCFWHLHKGCRDGTIPKTRIKYWSDKLTKNVNRDKKNSQKLRKAGWKVLCLWECKTTDSEFLSRKIKLFLNGSKIILKER